MDRSEQQLSDKQRKEQEFEQRMLAMRNTQARRAELAAKAKQQDEQAKAAAAKKTDACKHDHTREAVIIIMIKKSAEEN